MPGRLYQGVLMRESFTVRALLVVALLACLSTGAAGAPDVASDLPDTTAAPDSTELAETRAPLPNRVVVYYFHRTLRCDTCLKFEAYTDETLRSSFKKELDGGELEWRVVNLDEPGNEHFVDDYFITESSVVAVEFRLGEQADWTNLDAIWGLVGDKAAFLSFIRRETEVRLIRTLKPAPIHSSARDSVASPDDEPVRR